MFRRVLNAFSAYRIFNLVMGLSDHNPTVSSGRSVLKGHLAFQDSLGYLSHEMDR